MVLLLTGVAGATPKGVSHEFEQANRFYEDKDYPSAIRLYENILAQGRESAGVYFNLGNAYFKAGDLGHAVLNYLKAERLHPSDPDIQANLEFARRFSRVQMEGVKLNPISAMLDSLVGGYRVEDLGWLASALFLVTLVLLALQVASGMAGPIVRAGLLLAVVLTLLASAATTYRYRSDYITRRGVLVASEVPVYTGPSNASDIELHGAPGLVVEILDEEGGFYEVLFENMRKGYVEIDLLAEI
jgi:tetratricopeptide (TPR) repeat protein